MPNTCPDISIKAIRDELPPRDAIYWKALLYCRSVGFEKHSYRKAFWIARFRTKEGRYRRHRLGRADQNGKENVIYVETFEQALELAQIWFDLPENRKVAATPHKLGPTLFLNYQPVPSPYTVGNALVEYMAWKRLHTTKGNYLSMISRVNYHIIPRLAKIPANEMNGKILRQFVTEIMRLPAKRGNTPQEPPRPIESYDDDVVRKRKKTVNALLSILKGGLEMAWENEHVESDRFWRSIKYMRNVERPRMLHLSRAECRDLLKACRPDLRELVMGALYTGCRFTELINMRACHVGRDGYGVYVAPAKTLKGRFVFLPDEGMTFFLSLIDGNAAGEYIFRRRGNRKWKYCIRYPFKAALKEAKLPNEFTFHGLRHTYASQLIQSGAPLIVVADQLGHVSTETVSKTYGHLSPQIRESEVRQRFTSIDEYFQDKARREANQLKSWRQSLHGGDWRSYATIHDLTATANTNH